MASRKKDLDPVGKTLLDQATQLMITNLPKKPKRKCHFEFHNQFSNRTKANKAPLQATFSQ